MSLPAANQEKSKIASQTPLLDQIKNPDHLKELSADQLKQLADELRHETVSAVSTTGGHLGAGLGVVELTVAIHHIFNAPEDKLIWDVGHQCYPHKILTDRRDRIRTLRKEGGLSGFTKRSESAYDPFGAAHSSTSISAGLGMAIGRDLNDKNHHIISVIGDGAMSAGMAFEAMNNAGSSDARLIVILNDNRMSIDPPVGAMSTYLTKLLSSNTYRNFREAAKKVAQKFPKPVENAAKRAEEFARSFVNGGTLFEELGFYYLGPVDGHNLDHLIPVLKNARDSDIQGPVLIHAITQKGKGYEPAEQSADKYHGVSKFDVVTGKQQKGIAKAPSYTKVFANTLCDIAKEDEKIVALTAAMPSGTGLDIFGQQFPNRMFDVGIAEQHAVTCAAGMATEGLKPFAAIYSTFLQRAYDQVVHDVAIQKLPVRFAIDRAGLVGADGSTHAGSFDISYLGCLPNFVLMAASNEVELARMIKTAALIDDRPSAFRYPRGEATGIDIPEIIDPLDIGKGYILQEGQHIAILSYGGRLEECKKAALGLEKYGLKPTIADARFAKPLDHQLIDKLAKNHEILLTIEEGSVGGFGSFVMKYLSDSGWLDNSLKFRSMVLPDQFIDQASPEQQYNQAGLDAQSIQDKVLSLIENSNQIKINLKNAS